MADDHRYHQGEDAAHRFEATMSRLLKVSKAELEKREAAYQKTRAGKRRPRRPSR